MIMKLIYLVIIGVLAVSGTAIATLQPNESESTSNSSSEVRNYADELIYVKMLSVSSMTFIKSMDIPQDVKIELKLLLSKAIVLSQDNNKYNDRDACYKLDAFTTAVSTNLQKGLVSPAQANQLEGLVGPIKTALCKSEHGNDNHESVFGSIYKGK